MKILSPLTGFLLFSLSTARAAPGDVDLNYDPNVDEIMYFLRAITDHRSW
jgi:hypothetical protein